MDKLVYVVVSLLVALCLAALVGLGWYAAAHNWQYGEIANMGSYWGSAVQAIAAILGLALVLLTMRAQAKDSATVQQEAAVGRKVAEKQIDTLALQAKIAQQAAVKSHVLSMIEQRTRLVTVYFENLGLRDVSVIMAQTRATEQAIHAEIDTAVLSDDEKNRLRTMARPVDFANHRLQ